VFIRWRCELRAAAGENLERYGAGAEEVALGREKGLVLPYWRCGSHSNRYLIRSLTSMAAIATRPEPR